jgi:predicted GIY-YIG superfamily endonuclease
MITKLYVISAGTDSFKIGIAKNPESRLKAMQTGNHRRLTLDAVYNIGSQKHALYIEKKIHRALKKNHAHIAGEWFKYDAALIFQTIKKISEKYPDYEIPVDNHEEEYPPEVMLHMNSI